MSKERLDVLLVDSGQAASRERAKAIIMAGKVFVDGKKIDKAGTMVAQNSPIVIQGADIGYVSRGGLKLEKALDYFKIILQDKVVIDVGASTGGFTDCALQNGAAKVYAIDVGYGQLAWKLRTDSRVINRERTNVRQVTVADIGELVDFISMDVAFISLVKVMPVVKSLLKISGQAVVLIKPQFEAGKDKVGKKGVVKDPAVHLEVIVNIVQCANQLMLNPLGITYSPVKGPEGNIEYLLYLENDARMQGIDFAAISQVVRESHALL